MQMKCIQLSPEGRFDAWDESRREELEQGEFSTDLGQKVLHQDGNIKLWLIQLGPKERIGFRKLSKGFQVMSHSQGFAVSHHNNGEIALIQYKKGDIYSYDFQKMGEQVWDLENIGADRLEFVIIENLVVG